MSVRPDCGVCRFEGAEEAWSIIKAGPEPLVSQFSTSYSLVLNLLSVYTLDQARVFVSRSFGAFLQVSIHRAPSRLRTLFARRDADARQRGHVCSLQAVKHFKHRSSHGFEAYLNDATHHTVSCVLTTFWRSGCPRQPHYCRRVGTRACAQGFACQASVAHPRWAVPRLTLITKP